MAIQKRIGLGAILSVDKAGSTSFSAIGGIVDGFSTDSSADDIETSLLGDNIKTFRRGQIDPGELTFVVLYTPDDSGHQALVDLYYSGDIANWQITYPDIGDGTEVETFLGYVKGFTREISKDAPITAQITVKVVGDPGLTETPEA